MIIELTIPTKGEAFYEITEQIKGSLEKYRHENPEGILFIYIQHTSCALAINESFDPTAKEDMENFMKHLAPENLNFIRHTAEGVDDSPSHMKSILMQTTLTIPVHKGRLMLGQWQGIYLCEFRRQPKTRKLILKYLAG